MNALVMAVLLAAAGTLAVGVDSVWAQAKVAVTREESKPQKVEKVLPGEGNQQGEVR